ncbi:hypothetical protein, partial [Nonomuraea solani]
MELKVLHPSWTVSTLGFVAPGGVLLFSCGGQENAGVLGVADSGLGVEAEHCGEVERVRAVCEGFLKLPINAKAFERRSLTAELLGEVDLGDRAGAEGTQLI